MPTQNDITLEVQLGDLAYASLQGKIPGILDYLVGFQVLDSNEEQSKAEGVFGAKVGKDWIFIPALFNNGEIKGLEMMYLRSQDLFVPSSEDWLNWVIARRPAKLGEPAEVEEKDLSSQGLDTDPFRESPSTNTTKRAALEKAAQAISRRPRTAAEFYLGQGRIPGWTTTSLQPWVAPVALTKWAHVAPEGNSLVDDLTKLSAACRRDRLPSLPEWIREAGPRAGLALAQAFKKCSGLALTVSRYHKPESLLIRDFPRPKVEKRASVVEPRGKDVRILTYREAQGINGAGLSDEDRERLAKGEVVIKDERNDTNTVIRGDLHQRLDTVTRPGVYRYIDREGKPVRALIVPGAIDRPNKESDHPVNPIGFHADRSVDDSKAWVIRLDGPGVMEVDFKDLVAQAEPGHFPMVAAIPEAIKATEMKPGEHYVLVTPKDSATVPFRVISKSDTEDDQVHFRLSCCLVEDDFDGTDWEPYDAFGLTLTDALHGLKTVGQQWFAGDNIRAVKINLQPKSVTRSGVKYHEDREGFGLPRPADVNQVFHGLWENGKHIPLKLHTSGGEYHLTVGEEKRACSRVDTLRALIIDHNISGNDALEMVKDAETAECRNRAVRYMMIKRAMPDWLRDQGISAAGLNPGDMGVNPQLGVAEQTPTSQTTAVPGQGAAGAADAYNPDPNFDPELNDKLQQIAQTGQQDVFDTGMIGTLVKAVDSDDMVDKYIGDMILGMDRVGRTLFLFYDSNEQFAERYGQEDLLEMEDSLRNTFKAMGDLVLSLKKRSVRGEEAEK